MQGPHQVAQTFNRTTLRLEVRQPDAAAFPAREFEVRKMGSGRAWDCWAETAETSAADIASVRSVDRILVIERLRPGDYSVASAPSG